MIHPGTSRPSYIRVVAGAPGWGVSSTRPPSGKLSVSTFRTRSQVGSICSSAGARLVSNSLPSSPMIRNSRSPVTPSCPSRTSLVHCNRMPLTGAIASWETVAGTLIPPAPDGNSLVATTVVSGPLRRCQGEGWVQARPHRSRDHGRIFGDRSQVVTADAGSRAQRRRLWPELEDDVDRGLGDLPEPAEAGREPPVAAWIRSEERRVGKECRS